MTYLTNVVFWFAEYLPNHDGERPKHVEGLLHNCVLLCLYNYCAISGINIVKLSLCSERGCYYNREQSS